MGAATARRAAPHVSKLARQVKKGTGKAVKRSQVHARRASRKVETKIESSKVGGKIGSGNIKDAILNTNPSTPPNVSPGGLIGSLASGGISEIAENIDMIGEDIRNSRSKNATKKR